MIDVNRSKLHATLKLPICFNCECKLFKNQLSGLECNSLIASASHAAYWSVPEIS